MIITKWWGRNWRRTEGFGNGEGNGWDCVPGPNECRKDIGRLGIGFGNGLDSGRSGMLGDNVDEWMGEGLGNFLQSTKILPVEERVLHLTRGEKRRQRYWKMRWCG